MMYTTRPYRDERDLAQMLALVSQSYGASPSINFFHIGDVVWGMFQNTLFDPQQGIHLWFAGERLLGFAWHEPVSMVALQVAAGLADRAGLEAAMLQHAEQVARQATRPGTPEHTLRVQTFASDTPRVELLQERQYQLDDDFAQIMIMRCDLTRPLPDAPLPEGASVRAVGGEAEWAARVELHRTVWHPSRVTLEAYRRLRSAPVYQPELDLLALAPDGAPAAYCICWLDPANRVGEFEPVGTHPAHRQLGYGTAVMAEGLRRLRERGATAAIVYCVAENQAALRLYQSAGFATVDQHLCYSRPLAE